MRALMLIVAVALAGCSAQPPGPQPAADAAQGPLTVASVNYPLAFFAECLQHIFQRLAFFGQIPGDAIGEGVYFGAPWAEHKYPPQIKNCEDVARI